MGSRKVRSPLKCEGQKTSRGEQLLRRHWEENRHVHQLCAICLIFDHLKNIYCAVQLCDLRRSSAALKSSNRDGIIDSDRSLVRPPRPGERFQPRCHSDKRRQRRRS
jgi:hypothetical protein